MIILHTHHQLAETRRSRDLQKRVDEVVRDYLREHPDTTEAEVRSALLQSAPGGLPPHVERRRRIAAVGVAAAAVGAFTAISSGGGNFNSQTWLWISAIIAAVGGIAIAAIRLARRD